MGIVLCGLVVRALPLAGLYDELRADPDNYRQLAETLRTTGVFGWPDQSTDSQARPTAFRPPLYPVVLAVLAINGHVLPTTVAVVHCVLGAITVLLSYLVARRLNLGGASYGVAFAVGCDPILVNQSTLVMTETLAACVAALALYGLARLDVPIVSHGKSGKARSVANGADDAGTGERHDTVLRALVAGAALGLAVLCRPTFLAWVAVLLFVHFSHALHTRRSGAVLGLAVGVAVVIAPWIVRNYNTFGRPSATTTHGGYTLLLGNNPLFYDYLRSGAQNTWDATPLSEAWLLRRYSDNPQDPLWNHLGESPPLARDLGTPVQRNEFEDDRFAYRLTLHYIRLQPGMFLYSCAVRVARLWQLVPKSRTDSTQQEPWSATAIRLCIGIWYAVTSLLAVYGGFQLKTRLVRGPWLAGILLLASFTIVHAFYWSNMRMRAPLIPFVYLLAVAGLSRLWLKGLTRLRSKPASE